MFDVGALLRIQTAIPTRFGTIAGALLQLVTSHCNPPGDLLSVMCERAGFPQGTNLVLYEVRMFLEYVVAL